MNESLLQCYVNSLKVFGKCWRRLYTTVCSTLALSLQDLTKHLCCSWWKLHF